MSFSSSRPCRPTTVAKTIARALVDERLAACVNVGAPMMSIYRWQGSVEREAESQLVIKTTRDRVAAVEARLRSCILTNCRNSSCCRSATASQSYLDWVSAQTAAPDA